jgi:hypothetical protein
VLDCRSTVAAPVLLKAKHSWGHQVDLAVVWIFAEVLVGGLALGTLLILIRPRDDEAAALYRREPGRVWAWFRHRLVASRMSSKPDSGTRQ